MDADWYVDPLGRFDGRFFDGENWTERVSDGGALVVDSDFPPAELQESALDPPAGQFVSDFPAAAPAYVGRHLQASLMEESPVRIVAELDESVRKLPTQDAPAPAAQTTTSRRAPVIWGLLALIAALAVAAFVLQLSNDAASGAIAEPVQLDSVQEARVEDLEASGVDEGAESEPIAELEVDVPPGGVPSGSSFDPSETIEVGGLRVINGQSMLADLQAWHSEFAAERGAALTSSASCWFGQLGGAAVQVAFCGPVGGSVDTEFLFDSVQVVYESTSDGQIAQPVLDTVTIDMVLANALTLVGRVDDPSPVGD